MQRLAWIPNSTDTWLEKEELTVSELLLSKGWYTEFYQCNQNLIFSPFKPHIWLKHIFISYSQPHQRAAQGDCPHPPWQREKQPDPYRGGSPGCAGSQEGAAWACVTHGKDKLKSTAKLLQTGSWCAVTKYSVSCRRTSVQRTWSSNSVFIEPLLAKKGKR